MQQNVYLHNNNVTLIMFGGEQERNKKNFESIYSNSLTYPAPSCILNILLR